MITKFPICNAVTNTEGRYNSKLKWHVVYKIWVTKGNVEGIIPDYLTFTFGEDEDKSKYKTVVEKFESYFHS